jgi:hypothetical protein
VLGNAEKPEAFIKELLDAFRAPQKGRVLSLMGPNGAGKTKMLIKIADTLSADTIPNFRLPPERHFSGFSSTQLGPPTNNSNLDFLWTQAVNELTKLTPPNLKIITRPGKPVTLLTAGDALSSLLWQVLSTDKKNDEWYASELVRYHDNNMRGVEPKRRPNVAKQIETKLEQILGYKTNITMFKLPPPQRIGSSQERPPRFDVSFKRGDAKFGVEGLSHGERQILLLSIFLFSIFLLGAAPASFVFLADEPELYLNETRAIEVWERLEACFPRAVFLHATHNLVFATRPSVDRTYLMMSDGNVEKIDRAQPLPASVIRSIVGARIQLLRVSKPIIFCEDNLSELILKDVFQAANVELIPLSGHGTVQSAVRGESGWKDVRSEGMPYCGVIDRDARSDSDVIQLAKKGIFCFPVYEAESLLLTPEIAVWMLSLAKGQEISNDEFKTVLVECAHKAFGGTIDKVRKHLCSKNSPHINLKISGDIVKDIEVSIPPTLESDFHLAVSALSKAIKNEDVEAIIRLFKGKLLYSFLLGVADRSVKVDLPSDPIQQYRNIRAAIEFEQNLAKVAWLTAFKNTIVTYLRL